MARTNYKFVLNKIEKKIIRIEKMDCLQCTKFRLCEKHNAEIKDLILSKNWFIKGYKLGLKEKELFGDENGKS